VEALRRLNESEAGCNKRTINILLGSPLANQSSKLVDTINEIKQARADCWEINVLISTNDKDGLPIPGILPLIRKGSEYLKKDYPLAAYDSPSIDRYGAHNSVHATGVDQKSGFVVNRELEKIIFNLFSK